jgi:hypothetical protein
VPSAAKYQLISGGSGCLRGLLGRFNQLHTGRRPREPLSPPKASPRVLFARFSTTSDILAAPSDVGAALDHDTGLGPSRASMETASVSRAPKTAVESRAKPAVRRRTRNAGNAFIHAHVAVRAIVQ